MNGVTAILLIVVSVAACSEDESRLRTHIVASTNKDVRPVRSTQEALNLTLELNLQSVLEVDEHRQTIKAFGWIHQEWMDEYASWKPEDYGGATRLIVPHGALWAPDVNLLAGYQKKEATDLLVKRDGSVFLVQQAMFGSTCRDVPKSKNRITCSFTFVPWGYDSTKVRVIAREMQKIGGVFVENRVWKLKSWKTRLQEMKPSCCPDLLYHGMTTTLTLVRYTNSK